MIENFYSQNLGYTPVAGSVLSQDADGLCDFFTGVPSGFISNILKLTVTNSSIYAAVEVSGHYRIDINDVQDMIKNGVGPTGAVAKYGVERFCLNSFNAPIDSLVYVDTFGRLTETINHYPAVGIVAVNASPIIDIIWFGDWCNVSVPLRAPSQSVVITVGQQVPFATPAAYMAHLKSQIIHIPNDDGKFDEPATCKKCNFINEYKHRSEDYTCRRCLTFFK